MKQQCNYSSGHLMNHSDSPSMKNLLPQQLGVLLADCLQLEAIVGVSAAVQCPLAQDHDPFCGVLINAGI